MGKPCAVPNCNKNSKILQLKRSLFKVPTDETLRKKWQAVIPSLKPNQFICDRHFDDSSIVRRYVRYGPNGELIADVAYQRPHLVPNAVPTLLTTKDEIKQSVLQQQPSNNARPAKLDPSQEYQEAPMETLESPVVINPSQLHSPIKVEDVSYTNNEPALESIQSDSPMCDAPIVEISDTSEKEKDNASVLVESDNKAKTVEESVAGTSSDQPKTVFLQSGLGNIKKSSEVSKNISELKESVEKAKTVKESVEETLSDKSKIVSLRSALTNTKKSSQASENIFKLKVSTTSDISDGNDTVKLPTTWSVSQTNVKQGTEIIFCQMINLAHNETKKLIVKRYIVIENWSGRIEYSVYGKKVNANEGQLSTIVNDVSALPAVLAKFQRTRQCIGVGSGSNYILKDEAFEDYLGSWHHKDCTLITKTNKCESCKKFKKTLGQRQRRWDGKDPKRISAKIIDDRTRVKMLQKQVQTQRRLKNRANSQLKILKYRLQSKHEEMAKLSVESVEEKCRKSKASDEEILAMKEIFAAAKTTKKGRRYSEDWIMKCLLMHIRSPSYYKFLQDNDIIPLPCARTIRRYCSLIDAKCGTDSNFGQLIKDHLAGNETMESDGVPSDEKKCTESSNQ